MKKVSSIILVMAIALGAGSLFAACGEDISCAEGTVKEGGKCVPACASNEYFDGEQCMPVCEEGKYWDGTSCLDIPECDEGTTFNATTNRCEPDITACAPGTHIENGECVADYLPDPDYPESDTEIPTIDLAAEGESITIGGIVDTPVDLDDDGMEDADWDEFFFETTEAGVYLDLHATSEGATLPAFVIYGITPETCNGAPQDWTFFYERYALNPNGVDCHREVYLPMAGCYLIMVTDYNNLVDAVFGQGLVPMGGDEFDYFMTITTLASPVPSTLTSLPAYEQGSFEDGQLAFYALSGLAAGSVVNGISVGAPVEEVMSHAYPVLLVFGPDGHLMSESMAYDNMSDAEFLFETAGGEEYVVVQDFLMTIGPNSDFVLKVATPELTDCNVEDCTSGDLPEDGSEMMRFELGQNELFFHSALAGDEINELVVRIYDPMGNILSEQSSYYDFWYGVVFPTAYLTHQADNPVVIIKISEAMGAAVSYTQDIQFISESLLAEGDNTGMTVTDFPEYTYWDAGIDQFEAPVAGELVVFTGYQFSQPPASPIPLIMELDQTTLNAYNLAGEPTDPPFAMVPYTGRYLHWLFDYDPDGTAGFANATYDLTMSFLGIDDSVGQPADGVPVTATSSALDADLAMTAFKFTGVVDQSYAVVATPPAGSALDSEVAVYYFASVDAEGYLTANADGTIPVQLKVATSAASGDPVDTTFFTTPYTGDLLVIIRDTSGTAAGTETYDLSIGKSVCELGLSQCNVDGNLEVCDGYGWEETVCADECAMIGEEAACVTLINSLPYSSTDPRPAEGEINYYKMELSADATVDIEMTMGDCYNDDTILRLLDATGEQIAYNDDINYPADACSLISGQAITGGTVYYIAASVYYYSVSADYTLSVTAQ